MDADAGARTAGFVVVAVVAAFTPPLIPVGTVAFLGMAACLGAAAGAPSPPASPLVSPNSGVAGEGWVDVAVVVVEGWVGSG